MFFVLLGGTRLWDVDEAIFAETAREMAARGDAVVPYFNGQLFTHKPPLLYWGMMAAYRLFGTTEFAARLTSALCGVATVLVTHLLGRRLFVPAVGAWAGFILATCLQFALIARAATPDSLLVLFTSLAMLALVSGCSLWSSSDELVPRRVPQTSTIGYALAYASMAIGSLAKGPVAIVLPTGVWAMFLLSVTYEPPLTRPGTHRVVRGVLGVCAFFSPRRVLGTLWSMRPCMALAIVLLLAGPWYVLVGIKTQGEWITGFFGVHNFGRFLQPMDNHRGIPGYYLLSILGGLFPWSIFLSPMTWHLVQRLKRQDPRGRGDLLIVCWIGVWVGFFSLSSTKLPSYIAPAYPALAMSAARFLHQWLRQPASVARNWLRAAFAVCGVVGLTMMIALPLVLQSQLSHQQEYVWSLVGLPLVVAAATAWLCHERGRCSAAAYTLATAAPLFVVALLGLAAVRVDRFQTTPPLAARLRSVSDAAGEVVLGSYEYFRPSLVFYTEQPIAEFNQPADIRDFFVQHPGQAYLITMDEPYRERLASILPPDVVILDSSRRFLQSGQVLLLGRAPQNAAPPAAILGSHPDSPPAELR